MNELFDYIGSKLTDLTTVPFFMLLLMGLPLFYLARSRKTYPTGILMFLAMVPTTLTLAVPLWKAMFLPILAIDVAIVLVAFFDLWTLPARRHFSAERHMGHIASLGKKHHVEITLTSRSSRELIIDLKDDVPEEFEAEPDQFHVRLGSKQVATIEYDMRASRRGAFAMRIIYLQVRSRLGFWRRQIELPTESVVNVYPDMKQISQYALLARTNRLRQVGVRRTRRIGQDHDFERLRSFSRDDNYKHIDWRATARRNELTVKDFQSSQSQRIIFLIDCGRMMTNQASGMSLLDHSLNSMLMLSYVALKQGDSVGLLCFSDEIHTYVPPKGGLQHMNQLLHSSFDLFPRLVESRYDQAFLYLAAHCRKRSLVVLMTNVIDEVNSQAVEQYLGNLVGRHLPLGVMLRDHQMFDPLENPQPHGDELFRAAAAAQIVSWRHQVITDLQHKGVLAIDTFPEDMTAPLVNQYLEIKARHML